MSILTINMFLGWQTVYRGSDLECVCENLRPGTQYKVRVACTSSGGVSDFSDICHICTEPVSPGQCAPPRPHGKPKATSLHLKWGKFSYVYHKSFGHKLQILCFCIMSNTNFLSIF